MAHQERIEKVIYELRSYWTAPGKAEALNERFRKLTLRLFERHGMQVVGFWVPEDTERDSNLIYLLAFESREAMQVAWDAFRADPEWQAGKAASEVDGPLAVRVESRILTPTDYSPLQ